MFHYNSFIFIDVICKFHCHSEAKKDMYGAQIGKTIGMKNDTASC